MFIAQGPTQGETPTPQITGMITPGPRARWQGELTVYQILGSKQRIRKRL